VISWLVTFAAASAGAVQAASLARSARSHPSPLAPFARLMLVGAVLLVAARSGHVALGAAGWLVGFALSVALFYRRLR